MSENYSDNSDLQKLFLKALESKPGFRPKSPEELQLIVQTFLEEIQAEQEAEEPQTPLQDRG
jgi:hypothetical protein